MSLSSAYPSLVLASLCASVAAQEGSHGASQRREAFARTVLAGRVLAPDGAPAAGAIVRSSAGGEALAGPRGGFALEVEVALDAREVEVTAVGAGSAELFASARVVPSHAAALTWVGALALAPSDDCHERWLPTFGGQAGAESTVRVLAWLDDGGGPALFAAGDFESVNGTDAVGVAKRVGGEWQALGAGIAGRVQALAVFDDGGGPALYAGGLFTEAGGVTARNVARWDGAGWSALGAGLSGPIAGGEVFSLHVHDDGSGPALYAGGYFTSAGGAPASRVARWDGASWSALAGGVSDGALCMTTFDDGGGPALFVGGAFGTADGLLVRRIARWDGAAWSALGDGVSSGVVSALAVHDDGGGPALFAAGSFTSAGGAGAARVARWDGAGWSALGAGLGAPALSLASFDDGAGPELFAGGQFSTAGGTPAAGVARWDGAAWSAAGDGLSTNGVRALAALDDGPGAPALFAGGDFLPRLARWDGVRWSALDDGPDSTVLAVEELDLGSGPALYAGGNFRRIGDVEASYVARFDGEGWQALGAGARALVFSLAAHDFGAGPQLYVGGGGMLDRWDGSGWVELASSVSERPNGTVFALTSFDDGGGDALYAGGNFTEAGPISARGVVRWDGTSWSALGAGIHVSSGIGSTTVVRVLREFDDGGGGALYAGGDFALAGGAPAENVARWDGSSWSPVGAGLDFAAFSLVAHDGGGGAQLHAGGFHFSGIGRVSRWDGVAWTDVGAPLDFEVRALAVHDAGAGPALYAAGSRTSESSQRVARFDGSSWIPLGTWTGETVVVYDLESFALGGVPALIAGGFFVESPAGDSHLARFGCPSKVRPASR